MNWAIYFWLLSLLSLHAEKAGAVILEKRRSNDWLTSQNMSLGESATFSGQIKAEAEPLAPLTLRSGPVKSWQKGYQFVYRQKLASFLDLEFSPQFLLGAQPGGAITRDKTEADYFKRHEVTNLLLKPSSRWMVRGFSDRSEWQSLDTVNARRQETWGMESKWDATKWTKFRALGQQGTQEQSTDDWRERNSRVEFELTQKLGDSPFLFKVMKGWEDYADGSSGLIQRYVPKTEGVLSYAPSGSAALSMGLRLRSTEEPLAGRNTDQQTLFGEWNQEVTPNMGLRFQASHEAINETEGGSVNGTLERNRFVFAPQIRLNDAFKAQMEFRLTDEMNRKQAIDKTDQGVSLSIQGKF